MPPGIPVSQGLFSVLQHATLPWPTNRTVMTPAMKNSLHTRKGLIHASPQQPTHLRELSPHAPTWFGATDACGDSLGGVFFDTSGTPYVWQLPLPPHIQRNLRAADNVQGCLNIKALELAAHVTQILLKSLQMQFLEHILNRRYSTAAPNWNNKGSISSNNVEVQLLAWKALDQRCSCTIASGTHILG